MNRKHADVIRAWLDGAEIEWFSDGKWHDVSDPAFYNCFEYRVKKSAKLLDQYYVFSCADPSFNHKYIRLVRKDNKQDLKITLLDTDWYDVKPKDFSLC